MNATPRNRPTQVGDGWMKSSYTNNAYACVEVRPLGAELQVRDSKNPVPGALLTIDMAAWASFVDSVR